MQAQPQPIDVAAELWGLAGGDPSQLDSLTIAGPRLVLPSVFAVTAAASGAVGAALLAIAEFAGARRGEGTAPVEVDSRHATLSFADERHVQVDGDRPAIWADLSGYYETSDGWLQIHANFVHHSSRALAGLGLGEDSTREMVEAELRSRTSVEAEQAIVANDGVASAFRSRQEWLEHPHGRHLANTSPLVITEHRGDSALRPQDDQQSSARLLSGVRVLDLSRILAGPVAARTLAAFGADVIRLGAEHLPTHELSVALTAVGKRFAHLDLRQEQDRLRFFDLVTSADVVLTGFRPDSLEKLGVSDAAIRGAQPNIVHARLSAFGTTGPWGGRRGFDSITQTASGIAHEAMLAAGADRPTPLPCQLLDYASGYLLAAGIARSLTQRLTSGAGYDVDVVLARTGLWLDGLGRVEGGLEAKSPSDVSDLQVDRDTPYGRLTHMRQPGTIGGQPGVWPIGPELPGQSQPTWPS
ncbi:MAG: CoA transferase [Acidimicrobiales bacterium]